jgi:hypothetical protein
MKISQIILFSLFFLLPAGYVNGREQMQMADNSIDTAARSNYPEGLYVGTDRKLYITGEQVWFKIYKFNPYTYLPSDLSKIVFVELLNSLNNPVVQLKIEAEGLSGSGHFRLPDNLESGNYLLRAYTSWMLNFPIEKLFFKTISVINPFRDVDKLVPPVTSAAGNPNGYSGSIEALLSKKASADDKENLTISMNKGEYVTRDKVRLTLSVQNATGNPEQADLSLSVVKSYLADTLENILTLTGNPEGSNNFPYVVITHLPDFEGELIKGVIKNKITNEPLKNTDISISIVGKINRIQFWKTNEKGEFNFILKGVYGLNEIVIQPMGREIAGCYVELDPQFYNIYNDKKLAAFYLDSNKVELVNQAIISKQINALYEGNMQNYKYPDGIKDAYGFYYKPTRRIVMSDYIELTNIREIIKELVYEVNIENKNNEFILKVASKNPYEHFENQALVLVDGVPVYDIGDLLNVRAADIESIEIITSRYFYHNYIFEGIISFTTKTGNRGVFDFDGSVYRRVYEACQKESSFYSPDYSDKLIRDNRIPDFRNLLFWDPDVKISSAGDATCEFFTSDETGVYTVVAEGITPSGVKVYGTSMFTVK